MRENSSENLTGILLLAHGGPDSLEDIEPFLRNIRGGRGFTPKLLEEITGRYRQIGGRSPLLEISRRQAAALEQELGGPPAGFRVYLGMRNWHPSIRQAMEEIRRDGVKRLVALCLAPQNSRMSVGLYFERVQEAEKELGLAVPVSFIESYHDEPLLIEAFAEKLRSAMNSVTEQSRDKVQVVFTAHSLPEKVLSNGDPYDPEVRGTAAAVAARCGITDARFAYQSQGMTAEPWMGPKVESVIEDLASAGCKDMILSPIGFLCDHIEILWDIDIYFRRYAAERGVALRRTESLNDSQALARALGAVVRRHFAGERA
jgi:ferrochelatase